jgi:hypothetical protein
VIRARLVAAAVLTTCAACTLLLDRSTTQCQTDSDCAPFGTHPFCQSGVCVSSGLGPSNCFYGTPQEPQDFLNQCSAAECLSFDNCSRLGICGDAGAYDAALVQPPPADAAPRSDAVGNPGASHASANDGGATLPLCADPNDGRAQVVVLTGSSNFPTLLAKLAPLVHATGYTPVFQVTSSCTGVKSVFGTAPADHTIADPAPAPNAKYAAYYEADGTSVPCTLGPNGARVDVGTSDIFSTTCKGFGAPGDAIGEYLGPVQAMTFVVPGKSRETAITAEAAHAVFGAGGSAPWNNPMLYFVRNAGTGTQQMIGRAIGVPASAFWGVDRGTATNIDALMRVISDDALAQQAIGIISSDFYDRDRASLKALAFKASGQSCAYLPDSTEFTRDKRNVRDGHYPIWGPVHFFTALANGVPVSPAAQAFVSVVSALNVQKALLDAFIASGLVPTCAMSVQRSTELGPLSAYAAPFPCGCYFEASPAVNGVAPPECKPCSDASDCTDPKRPACDLGYCEVQ